MSLIKREQISLYDEAKASFVSLIKQTSLVFLGVLIMLLITGGNPPGSVVVMSFVLGMGFVAWSENKRLSNAKARQKAKAKAKIKQEQVNKIDIKHLDIIIDDVQVEEPNNPDSEFRDAA